MLLLFALAGCASEYVSLRKSPQNPLADQLGLLSWSGPKPSPRAMQVLRRYGLADELKDDCRELLAKLERFHDQEPKAETGYTLAEVAYLGAEKMRPRDRQAALDLYGTAAMHAYRYLFDFGAGYRRNVFDPEFRQACDVYNASLEGALRLFAGHEGLKTGTIKHIDTGNHKCEVTVVCRGRDWPVDNFERFEFVSDYEARGLTNQYHTYGLGVPLIGIRRKPEAPLAAEKFYPPGLSLPVTAFLRVHPRDPGQSAGGQAVLTAHLELHDPLTVQTVDVAGMKAPLESDLSTPLAYFLNKPALASLPTIGLLNPDKYAGLSGLYMVQPYEPNKIPVLMVHGLWSSPITWMEMFNDLRSDPLIRDRYQFWFYLYPTGQPFWISAAQLRADLAEARQVLDPNHAQSALDQMVLVGHSMGGLVSGMQTIESGNVYWNTVSKEPLQLVKADTDVKQQLASTFYFHANSSVKRVVTIGTPHRGSNFANDATRFLSHKLIAMPRRLMDASNRLYRDNPQAFDKNSLLRVSTSIDSLAPDCPVLPVLLNAPRPLTLKRHNIVGVVENAGLIERVNGRGDGVVPYDSAHLDNVESEIVVNADHLHVHRHPIAVLEVRRVLLAHLQAIYHEPSPRMPRVYQASVTAAPLAPPAYQYQAPRSLFPATSGGPALPIPAITTRTPLSLTR